MSIPHKIGLTLGKFAPLHKGHQLVIEAALAEMDELRLVIYDCPEVTPIPLPVRAGWIKTLYPTVQVIEAWGGPAEVGDTPEIKRSHENYLLNDLKLSGITHFYSSEFYGDHISQAFAAVNRQVDAQRLTVPVSGTAIRANPYAFRDFLHPTVYRDHVANIVFWGAPSTGKTTLTERLAQEYNTVWMPEYGREYWAEHQSERRLVPEQLVEIAEGHLEREERLLREANRFLFTDTHALTTRHFAHYYHGFALPRLEELADNCASRYDLVFVCDTDIPYADTWDRSGDVNRQMFQKQILAELHIRKIPYVMLRGDVEARLQTVKTLLSQFTKWTNFYVPPFL